MTIVMELEPQYPLIWLWSRKVERRWVVIWSWLDGKDCSALNLLASKAFDLPHPTKGRSSS
ncbi:unnamed protein product [Brassica oleracea]|uniref:(rape) hypothetical protein n=1 Tax=Brassica napus TaxID=3708 RepID=A0A816LDG4_BRANA|nr:unnamed protein product [Brassica napus]